MHVPNDAAAQAEHIVIDYLRTHGPTTLDVLVGVLVTLPWAKIFSAVDRLSRANTVQLRQTKNRD